MHLRSGGSAWVSLSGGLAADAERDSDEGPADELAGKPVDLVVDGVVELTSLVGECGEPRGRLPAAAGPPVDDIAAIDVGHGRGQRVLSVRFAVAAALSSSHADEPAGVL